MGEDKREEEGCGEDEGVGEGKGEGWDKGCGDGGGEGCGEGGVGGCDGCGCIGCCCDGCGRSEREGVVVREMIKEEDEDEMESEDVCGGGEEVEKEKRGLKEVKVRKEMVGGWEKREDWEGRGGLEIVGVVGRDVVKRRKRGLLVKKRKEGCEI